MAYGLDVPVTLTFAVIALGRGGEPHSTGHTAGAITGAPVATNISRPSGGRRIERRRPKTPDQPPFEALQQMPALVVLERLPAPALAVERRGAIVFVNGAFCEMVGYSYDELSLMTIADLWYGQVPADCPFEIALIGGDSLVKLRHKHGHTGWAGM